jgi:hypothetical protein
MTLFAVTTEQGCITVPASNPADAHLAAREAFNLPRNANTVAQRIL